MGVIIYHDKSWLGRPLLGALAAIVISGDCIAQTAPSPPPGSSSATISPAPWAGTATPPAIQEVIISGTPSLLRVRNPWPWADVEQPCATFRVSAAASIAALDIYTSGLGRALLAETASDQGADCPDVKQWRDRITLARHNSAAAIDQFVAIKVDPDPLSTPGASMQGGVVVLAGVKKGSEFALKVERPPPDESWTAITWVLSVFIPAIITFLIAQAAVRLGAQQKENTDFRDYRLINMTAIMEFFTKVDRVIRSPQDHPGQTVYALIAENSIFSKMPIRGARTISEACVADDLATIVEAFRTLFPEFKQSITQLQQSLQILKQQKSL